MTLLRCPAGKSGIIINQNCVNEQQNCVGEQTDGPTKPGGTKTPLTE